MHCSNMSQNTGNNFFSFCSELTYSKPGFVLPVIYKKKFSFELDLNLILSKNKENQPNAAAQADNLIPLLHKSYHNFYKSN